MVECNSGYKEVNGKCVKKKSLFSSSNKKSYNPFKMWGSWVGAVIGIIVSYLALQGGESMAGFIMSYLTLPFNNSTLSVWIISPVVGFLIGWGIHSLIRKFKK